MTLRAKEKILTRNLKIIRSNLHLLEQFFQNYPKLFAWEQPTAESTTFPKLLASIPIDKLVENLRVKEGVMLLPSSAYEFPENYFRLGVW